MKIILTTEESENIFHQALCNGHKIAYYGLQLDYNWDEYKKAKERLSESSCLEDIWMEMLRGGATLTLIDENGGMGRSTITLADVHSRVCDTPVEHLLNVANETDDADTADAIIQTVFYQEIIFG
jgi:hypothetical protein